VQDTNDAIEAILTSNLIAQFKQANGEEPSAEEVEEMISEMKEEGLYDEAAERISELLEAGADEEELLAEFGAPPAHVPKKKRKNNKRKRR
jgi:hypothetical protein